MTAVALHNAQGQQLSVIEAMASQYGMRAQAFEATLRATVVPERCTREEFAAFILVAREYGLNPILKEIYAIPKKGGGIQPIVGVDGWYNITNKHPQFDGIDFDDTIDDKGNVTAITCKIYRKDRTRPIAVTEYLSECRQNSEPWQKWPRRMLRHKAAIQAARVAFGFSGIVDPDEAARFTQPQRDDRHAGRRTEAAVRTLQTIEAASADFAEDEYHDSFAAAPPSAAETPADPVPAGEPASSVAGDTTGDAGTPDPVAEAREAGRKACEEGADREVPKRFQRYLSQSRAWLAGYDAYGADVEATMGDETVEREFEATKQRNLSRLKQDMRHD